MRLASAFRWLFAQDVIRETAPSVPLAELVGDEHVLIENHHGVTQYDRDRFFVRVSYGQLCVFGENLTLHCVKKHQLVICGTVQKLEIVRQERGNREK